MQQIGWEIKTTQVVYKGNDSTQNVCSTQEHQIESERKS